MSNQDYLAQLRKAYLAGKSERMKAKFMAKTPDQQEFTLKSWEYRMRRAGRFDKPALQILEMINKVIVAVQKANKLADEDLAQIANKIDKLNDTLDQAKVRIKENMISELERQQEEIQNQLNQLRSN